MRDHSRLEKFKSDLRDAQSRRGSDMKSISTRGFKFPRATTMSKLERPTIPSADKLVSWQNHSGNHAEDLDKLNTRLSYDAAMPLLGIRVHMHTK